MQILTLNYFQIKIQYFSMKSLRYSVIKTQVQNELSKHNQQNQDFCIHESLQYEIEKFKSNFTIQEFFAQYLGSNNSHRLVHCLIQISQETQTDSASEQTDIYDHLLKPEFYEHPSQFSERQSNKQNRPQITNKGSKSEVKLVQFQNKTCLSQKEHLEAVLKSLGQLTKMDQEKEGIIDIISNYSLKQEIQCVSKKHQDFKCLWRKVCSKIEIIKKADSKLNQQQIQQIFSFVQNLISIHKQIQNRLSNFIKLLLEKENLQFDSNSSNITISTTKRSLLTQALRQVQQKKTEQKKSVSQSLKQYRIQNFGNKIGSQAKNEMIGTIDPIKQCRSGQALFGEPFSMANKKIKNAKTKSSKVLFQQIDMNSGEPIQKKRNKQIKQSLNSCGSCSKCIIF